MILCINKHSSAPINIVSFGYFTLMVMKEEKGAQVLIVPELVDFIVSALDKVRLFI